MADAAILERQFLGFEDFVREHAAQRNLGRRHQAQIAIGNAIDLRLGAAGM